MKTGIMQADVELLGTSLSLQKGQRVRLTEATNLPPGRGKWFAAPLDGKWADGIDHGPDDSILISAAEVDELSG